MYKRQLLIKSRLWLGLCLALCTVATSAWAASTFIADYENGSLNGDGRMSVSQSRCCQHSMKIVGSPVRQGSKAARFESRYSDPKVGGAPGRAETKFFEEAPMFTTWWYRWSVFVPTSVKPDGRGTALGQLHTRNRDACDGNRNAVLWFYLTYNDMAIKLNASDERCNGENKYDVKKEFHIPFTRGVWLDWIVQIHYDYRTRANGGQGFCKIWLQRDKRGYKQVVDYYGQVGYNDADTKNVYLKYGIYPHGWRQHPPMDGVNTKIAFFDNVMVGNSASTLQDFLIGGGSPPPQPTGLTIVGVRPVSHGCTVRQSNGDELSFASDGKTYDLPNDFHQSIVKVSISGDAQMDAYTWYGSSYPFATYRQTTSGLRDQIKKVRCRDTST